MVGPSSFSLEPCTTGATTNLGSGFLFLGFSSLSLSPSRLLSLLPLMVLKGEFEDGVGFEFMVLWVDFLGEPVWDWCCVKPCGGWFLGKDFGFLDEPVWGVIG
uniref:Uncharacterized protein n=1 Tax=Fagus sylvatica TaxID=28930 RepID=A0A2N9IBM5_FAGSY